MFNEPEWMIIDHVMENASGHVSRGDKTVLHASNKLQLKTVQDFVAKGN